MRKIVLACAAGVSTNMLVKSMRKAASETGYVADIEAFPVGELKRIVGDADIVLLGPQIRFMADKVREMVDCPICVVDMAAYGMMDGAKALAQAREVLGD